MVVHELESEPPGVPGRFGGGQAVGSSAVALDVLDASGGLSGPELAFITDATDRAAASLGLTGEVRVRIVNDAEMTAAHERYSGIAGTTDVLTFDLRGESERVGTPTTMDVDIVVCLDEARRAASVRGHRVEQELVLYIVHGLLHCLGHDDHDEAAYERMHALEDQVLESIGVGRVFSGSVGAEPREEGVN